MAIQITSRRIFTMWICPVCGSVAFSCELSGGVLLAAGTNDDGQCNVHALSC